MAEKAVVKHTRQSVLRDLISARRCTTGAELGIWQAQTLEPLLRWFPRLHMVAVDKWEAVGAYAEKDMAAARRIALHAIAPYRDRVTVLQTETVAAARLIRDASLDFVFIDASHDTESVLADIRAWLPKLKPDGILTGHDSNMVSVRAALDEAVPGWLKLPANVWMGKSD